jgi:hypothetical protein
VRFFLPWLARCIRLSVTPARQSLRRLIELGALRLVARTNKGHVVEVRLPEEIRPARPEAVLTIGSFRPDPCQCPNTSVEDSRMLLTNSTAC